MLNRILCLCLINFVLIAPAWSLGSQGHIIVCQMAFDLLDNNQQKNINQLLSQLSAPDKLDINKFLKVADDAPIDFAKSCVWADAIKRQPQYEKFKMWHFVNVSRQHESVKPQDCLSNCVPRAIEFHHNKLLKGKSSAEQLEALLFLSHWLGDIHQPLHVSYADDLGGNKVKVISETDKCTNLHWLWDSCLLPENAEVKLITELKQQLSKTDTALWLSSTPWQWATESLVIVRDPATQYCQLDNTKTCQLPANSSTGITLADHYIEEQSPVLKTRMLQASVRLAGLLSKFN